MSSIFTIQYLKSKKIEAMKTKNVALKNVISLILGDADTLLKNHATYVNHKNEEISEFDWIKSYLSKMLKNLEGNLSIYEDRGDVDSIEKTKAEIDCIRTEFLKPLTIDEVKDLLTFYLEKNPNDTKPSGFMAFLVDNVPGQYNGKEVVQLFFKEIQERKTKLLN